MHLENDILDEILRGHGLGIDDLRTLKLDIDKMQKKEDAFCRKIFDVINNGEKKGQHPFEEVFIMLTGLLKVASFISIKSGIEIDVCVVLLKKEYEVFHCAKDVDEN